MQSGCWFSFGVANSLKVFSALAISCFVSESLDESIKSTAKFNLGDEDEDTCLRNLASFLNPRAFFSQAYLKYHQIVWTML